MAENPEGMGRAAQGTRLPQPGASVLGRGPIQRVGKAQAGVWGRDGA